MVVCDAHMFPNSLIPILTQLSFHSHKLPFSHASDMKGKNMPVRKFASTAYQTHNHMIMGKAHLPLKPPGGAYENQINGQLWKKK